MKKSRLLLLSLAIFPGVLTLLSCGLTNKESPPPRLSQAAQVPTWSGDDLEFYTHGSMSTEVVPETVLRSFIKIYPDIFPTADLSHLGSIPDPDFGWPVGFTRAKVAHLGGLSSVGINCASCHTAQYESPGAPTVRVLGAPGVFDAEAFFGSIVVSTFRTADPANMKRFLAEYLDQSDPEPSVPKRAQRQARFEDAWQKQATRITAAIAVDSAGAKGAGPGGLQAIPPGALQFTGKRLDAGIDLAQLSADTLKLFHNMRTALHVPDQPPETPPPASGPGRNDAFGLLSAALFNSPQPHAPVKYGLVWNVENRPWVHWDGNTPSPIARNVLATLGLGATLVGNHGVFDLKRVQRQTDITEKIRPPKYPYPIAAPAAERGKALFQSSCVSCHDGTTGDDRLYAPEVVKTDPVRARLFTQQQADKFNQFLARLETAGYTPPTEGLRSTNKYYAPALTGVWARSPYLHNGSVRTMQELLTPPASRPVTSHRGSHNFDPVNMGLADEGPSVLDTRQSGNSNAGHDYGTSLTPDQKRDLIEFLKTL